MVSLQVCSGIHPELAKFVQASTTIGMFVVPVMLNPNLLVHTPKLASLVCACGFHNTGVRPAIPLLQPVAPGK